MAPESSNSVFDYISSLEFGFQKSGIFKSSVVSLAFSGDFQSLPLHVADRNVFFRFHALHMKEVSLLNPQRLVQVCAKLSAVRDIHVVFA
jgi:hypothetical protein